MTDGSIVTGYVQACVGGGIPFMECSSVWELGLIATLLAAAISALATTINEECLRPAAPIFWAHQFSPR